MAINNGTTFSEHNRFVTWLGQVVIGGLIGAWEFGHAGLIGGATLGVFGEVCAHRLWMHPTKLRFWIEAFVLAGLVVGWISGAAQDGWSGAFLGAAVGGTVGLLVGLVFGWPICVGYRLMSRRA